METKQTTSNFGWVSSAFVRLMGEKRLLFALYVEDSETGKIVAVIVINPYKIANHAIMNTVR